MPSHTPSERRKRASSTSVATGTHQSFDAGHVPATFNMAPKSPPTLKVSGLKGKVRGRFIT